jgi:hypothetical protein
MCGAIGVSWIYEVCIDSIKHEVKQLTSKAVEDKKQPKKSKKRMSGLVAGMLILLIAYFLVTFVCHGVMSGAEAYSSPSVVLSSKYKGQRYIIDDYR